MPPQRWVLDGFASGLISIANYVQRRTPGWAVRLVDLSHVPARRVRAELAAAVNGATGPLIVGITTTTATYHGAISVARAAKAIDPTATVVLGGHHASPEDEVVLTAHPTEVDLVIRGEGERPLAGLLSSFPNWRLTPGLSYLDGSRVVRTGESPRLDTPDLDDLPPFLDGAETNLPLGRCGRVTYVSARGCPLGCSFCAVARAAIRAKSVPAVIRDLEILVRGYGFTSIGIEDNFFAQSKSRTLALCSAIAEFRRSSPDAWFRWDCQTRVESLADPAIVRALADAGCDGVFLGVESFHPDILESLNKTRTPERYLELLTTRVLPAVLDARLACHLNLQFATPGETDTHRRHDVAVLRHLGALAQRAAAKVVVCPMLAVVYPGTETFARGVESGAWPRDVFETFVCWEAENAPVRRWLGRHFAHGTGGIPLGILRTDELRRCEFRPDVDRILAVDNHLRDLRSIPGIEVFDYEPHVVGDTGVRRTLYTSQAEPRR